MNEILIRIVTEVKKAIDDIDKSGTAINNVGKNATVATKQTGGFGSALTKLAGVAGVAVSLAKVTQEVIKFSKESLDAASRAQELTAKFNTVFGSSAPGASSALDDFGDAVHRSGLALQEMGADMQNVLVGMGTSRSKAADMSVELTKLAVDVAAFNNAADADVLNNFQSAITGNAIAAKKYGIILNEANMNAALLKMGIEGGTQAATEAEKVQARYNIIMESTADAHGAAAREADSYTNVSKGLEAAMLDLQIAVGQQLIPTMTTYKRILTDVVTGITENIERSSLLKEAYEAGIITQEEYRDATYSASAASEYSVEKLQELIAAYEEENNVIIDTQGYLEELTVAEGNYQGALDEVTAAQRDLEAAQQGWLKSTANEVVSALQGLDSSAGDYMAALAAIDDVYGTSEQAEQIHKDRVREIVDQYGQTGNIDDFKAALQGLADDEMPATTESLEKAREKADELYRVLEDLKNMGKITVEVEYIQSGSYGMPASGLFNLNKPGFASGGSFVVPPGYSNDSYTIGVSSREKVSVTPASAMNDQDALLAEIRDLLRIQQRGLTAEDIALAMRDQFQFLAAGSM